MRKPEVSQPTHPIRSRIALTGILALLVLLLAACGNSVVRPGEPNLILRVSPYDADIVIASTANQIVQPRAAMAPNGGRELELRYVASPGFYAVRASAAGMESFTSTYEVKKGGVVTVEVDLGRDRSRGTPGSPGAPDFPILPTLPDDPTTPVPTPVGDTVLVDAGSNVTSDLTDSVRLEGRIYGDSSKTYHASWSVVSGPGKAIFTNNASPVTSVSFEKSGTYLLKLDVATSDASGADTVTVNVRTFDGTIYYVAPGGSDGNDGTSVSTPFKTLNKAGRMVGPGDIVRLRQGVYYEYNDSTSGLGLPQTSFTTHGTAERPIVIESYPGEHAVLDGSRRPDGRAFGPEDGPSNPQRPVLLYLPVNHYIVRNLEARHSVGAGIRSTPRYDENAASFNLYSNLHLHHNHGDGLTASGLSYKSSSGQTIDRVARGNVAEFIVSHHNASTRNGGNSADGIKMSHAENGVIRNSLLYKNSDDGTDFIGSQEMLVEESMTWLNGYFWPANDSAPFDASSRQKAYSGNGQGFKMAGASSGIYSGNLAVRNLAWQNKGYGFTHNSGGGVGFYHNTTWANGAGGFSARCYSSNILRNNLSHQETQNITADGNPCKRIEMPINDHNSWNLALGNPQLASTNPLSPAFLQLTDDSPAIDVGSVLETFSAGYTGDAPDLGALEFGVAITGAHQLALLDAPLGGGSVRAGR